MNNKNTKENYKELMGEYNDSIQEPQYSDPHFFEPGEIDVNIPKEYTTLLPPRKVLGHIIDMTLPLPIRIEDTPFSNGYSSVDAPTVVGYSANDKPFEIETNVTDAGNIDNFTEEQIPIIVNMLNILENQGVETLWAKMTPAMFDLAMNHSVLSYELEEFYMEDNNKYDVVINDDLNKKYGLMISIFGKDFE